MPDEAASLGRQYAAALDAHLKEGGASALNLAAEIGRQVLDGRLGLREAFALHASALENLGPASLQRGSLARANEFFTHVLAPLESRYRDLAVAHEQLDRANKRLVEQRSETDAVNQELESFRYSVSHDLRAPLRAIDGFSGILAEQSDRLDEEGRHCLQIIRSSAARMGQLIEDLLLLVRVGRSQLNRQRVDISDMARKIADELHSQQPERKAVFDIQPGLIADADDKLLRIVMENLLGNAWKFTSKTAEPRISFGAERSPEGPVFFVRDNGVGFNMEYAGKLFVPFQRLHSEAEFPGTGGGLVVVRRIIERHGGRIWVESATDRGAAFFFTLPPAEEGSATME